MKFAGWLKQNTAVTKLLGQLISYEDGKTTLFDELSGNDNFDPTLLKCTLSKNTTQTQLNIFKDNSCLVITGCQAPDANGYYLNDGLYNGYMSYKRTDSAYYVWYDINTYHSYVLSVSKGNLDTPYFAFQSSITPIGIWNSAFGETEGSPVGSAGEYGNEINLVAGGMATLELTAADTNTEGMLIISLENATAGSEVILSDAWYWIVLNETAYNQMFGVTSPPTAAQIISAIEAAGLSTEANATINKNTIVQAISDKPVTPVTDISGLAAKEDIDSLNDISVSDIEQIITSGRPFMR